MYTCMYVCISPYTYDLYYVHIDMYARTYAYMYVCMYVCKLVCIMTTKTSSQLRNPPFGTEIQSPLLKLSNKTLPVQAAQAFAASAGLAEAN